MTEHSLPDIEIRPGNEDQKNSLVGLSIIPDDLFILERPRVNALLENACMNPAVLVIAGEGYGKTTAVHSFLSKRNDIIVWIPLSERDNDPVHFWESVTNAEGFYNTRIRKALEKIGFPETPSQINRCYQVLSERTPPYGGKRVIVADDFHLIRKESILAFIRRMLGLPFPQTTFILVSRTEQDFNTMPLFSKGILSRVTARDLRFTEEEISDYFRLKEIKLNPEEPGAILADTEGWVTALNIIAEEMKSGEKRYSPFLWEEGRFRVTEEALFASIPASLQRFLVVLSLFDQWPLEALERIAAALPEKLPPLKELSGNMFRLSALVHYDTYLHGFRIHRAFLDYLREKQKELSPEEIKNARLITARWCGENNLYIDAAFNYGMAGDYRELLSSIHSGPRIKPRPAAASLLKILDRIFESGTRNEEDENFLFLRHVTRAGLLLNLGRYDESRTALNESVKKFESLPRTPVNFRILSACYNALGSLSFASCLETGDISRAPEYFERGDYYYTCYPYPVSGPVSKIGLGSYVNLVRHPPEAGAFETFLDTLTRCIPYTSHSMGGYLAGADNLCRAELAFFKGDLNAAEQHARKAVFNAREKGQYEIESRGLFYLHRVHLCNGNTAAGRETWEQMEAQLDKQDYINRYAIYDITAGWFNAHIGKTEEIAPWLRNGLENSDLNLLFHNFETIVKAKSLFAEKKFEESLEFLTRKEVLASLGAFHLGMLEITVLTAVVQSRVKDEAGALKTLESAYAMSVPNSLDMPFIELGEDMRILAGTALGSRQCSAPRHWLEMIRNRASVYAKKLNSSLEQRLNGRGAEDPPLLTSQELSVLESISRGLTREEISALFSIPVNSVKGIINIIYDKLGAFNSADAIRIASGLNLLKHKEEPLAKLG